MCIIVGHVDEQFTVVFMTVSHSAQMLLKLEKCIPISHVTLETVPKYANIERPTSSQLYASYFCTVVLCVRTHYRVICVWLKKVCQMILNKHFNLLYNFTFHFLLYPV